MHTECGRFHWPSSNKEYWKKKITRNVQRDMQVHTELENRGWHVIVIWECQLKRDVFTNTMENICKSIRHI